jgi:uncharacterized protein YgbK (DUF1537 family)
VFTSSRGLAPAAAGRRAFALGRSLRASHPQRVYKKIDSALRGPIGAEVEAVMEALDLPLSFIAPAFPEQGRTTVGGIHRIHGVPVAETEMGRDPLTPVTESSLPKWIGGQTRLSVAQVGLETMEAGVEAMAGQVERLRGAGARHITFDATRPLHLEHIAALALNRFPQALLCGSAGLACGLVRQLPPGRPPETAAADFGIRPAEGRFLFVCGSASQMLRRQAGVLARGARVALEILEPAALLSGEEPGLWADGLDRAVSTLCGSDLALQLAPPVRGARVVDSEQLVIKFAEFAAAAIARAKVAGLFLSGGDTALAVLEQIDVSAVRLERELSSGLVYGTLSGGPLSGRPVVTKAGAFGRPETLLELHRLLRPNERT